MHLFAFFAFPPACITGVILGCRADEQSMKNGKTLDENFAGLVKTDRRYSHVALSKAVLDEQAFKVNVVPYNSP